jgi:hypothetical protein
MIFDLFGRRGVLEDTQGGRPPKLTEQARLTRRRTAAFEDIQPWPRPNRC